MEPNDRFQTLNDDGFDVELQYSRTPLMNAILEGNIERSLQLIARPRGADVNKSDNHGQTALMFAAENNNEEIAKLLIENGADVNIYDEYHGQTALMFAAERNNEEIAKLLIENGAGVNVPEKFGETALMFAAEHNKKEIAKLLIEKGADVNISNEHRGQTALTIAAKRNNEEIAKLLIEKGADVNTSDKYIRKTALMFAAEHNGKEIAKLLIEKGASVNVSDTEWQTALLLAAEHNNEEIAKLLIEKGADVNISDKYHGQTALVFALKHNSKEIAKLLIEKGADVNISDKYHGQTALMFAAEHNNEEIAKLLIEKGAGVNVPDKHGQTALMFAAEHNSKEIAKLLIENDAVVNVSDEQGRTALFYAIKENNEELVQIIVKYGGDVNTKDNNGQTPLFYAVKYGSASMVCFLINASADVNVRNINQETVLFNAVRGNPNTIKAIVDDGKADVNTRNGFGKTPLFDAVTSKFAKQTVPLLLEKGAKINDTDNCHFSVLSFYIDHQCDNKLTDNKVEILDIFTDNGIQRDEVFSSLINIMYSKFPCFFNSESQGHNHKFASKAVTIAKQYAHNKKQKRLIKRLEKHLTGETLDYKHLELLDILIQLGANPNSVDTNGNTALHYTVQLPFFGISKGLTMKIVLQLENHGARFDIENHQGQTPLMFCLSSWDRDNIDWLNFITVKAVCRNFLKRAPPIRQCSTSSGKSVFHLLMKLFQDVLFINDRQTREKVLVEMFELLKLFCHTDIVKGVMINKADDELQYPLHLWALLSLPSKSDYAKSISGELTFENIMKTIFKILLDCGVMLNAGDTKDQTPLHHCKTWSAFTCLIKAKAKPNNQDLKGRPPLLAAAHHKVFMQNPGHFFPDVTDDPKSFFTRCVDELDLDLWACDNEGKSVLSLLLASETFVLAEALVEVACEFNPSVLEQLLTVICQDKSRRTFWKSQLVQKILTCRSMPLKINLNLALRSCCILIIKELHEKERGVSLEKEKEDYDETPTKKVRTDDSSASREDWPDSSSASVHLQIARQLRINGANGEYLCTDFPQLRTLLTGKIDRSKAPMIIPWTSYSKTHKAKLGEVARRQNVKTIGTSWFHKEPIGEGSFGHVFAGINEKDGREIAIKKIDKMRIVRPEDKREIRNLTALADCEQVVTYIYFIDIDDSFAYIVLELMEGHLDEYFKSTSFDPHQSVSLCKNVVIGLNFLHNLKPNPILHRDLKPGNILYKVHPKICLKIADFGLSSPLTTTGTTVLRTNIGTRCWIAPEVMRKHSYKHSEESDNYSCGLLLHYILSVQKHPFSPADCSMKTIEIIDHETQNNMLNNTMDGWDDKLSPEATHLIKSLLSSNVAERLSAADSLSHPLFWSKNKKKVFLSAFGNQPVSDPLVVSDLEAKFSTIVQHPTWIDASYSYMPSFYVEMAMRRPYNTGSVVELVRFIRNSIAHASDAGRPRHFAKQILEDVVFLEEFPHLVIEVFKIVNKHGWETRDEIKVAMSSE